MAKDLENETQKGGLSLEESLAIDKMTTEEWFAWMAKRNETRKQAKMGINSMDKPKIVEDEKRAILTPEEMEEILSGEVSPEEMISRWEKESGN